MTAPNLISDFIPPFTALPNVAPFTYEDGVTYLGDLHRIVHYVNGTLVSFINTQAGEVSTEINDLITQVNTALTDQDAAVTAALDAQNTNITETINNSFTVANLDPKMEAVIAGDLTTRDLLNSLYEAVGTFTDANLKTILIDSDSASRVSLDAIYEAKNTFSDAAMEAIIATDDSLTRVELDSLYSAGGGGGFSDAAMNAVLEDDTSASRTTLDATYAPETTVSFTDAALETILANGASASRVELDSVYEKKTNLDSDIATIMAIDGSLSRVELNLKYALISQAVIVYDTLTNLEAATPGPGSVATAIDCPNALFVMSDQWHQATEAIFDTDATALEIFGLSSLPERYAYLDDIKIHIEWNTLANNWQKTGIFTDTTGIGSSGSVVPSVDSFGTITVDFVEAGSVIFSNLIPVNGDTNSTFNDIDLWWNSPAAQSLSYKLANAGVTDTAVDTYDEFGSRDVSGLAQNGITNLATDHWSIANSSCEELFCRLNILNINDDSKKTVIMQNTVTIFPGDGDGDNTKAIITQINQATSAWTGFEFTADGPGTMIIKVRPQA